MTAPANTRTRTACPTSFCVSPHDEPAGVSVVHVDQPTYLPTVDGDVRVDVQQMEGRPVTIYVDDRAYTLDQADALAETVARKVYEARRAVTL